MISIIVAVSENSVIGKDNKLLWHIKEDLQRFKRITLGHSVIMGRKTYESIGTYLKNRTNIILSKSSIHVSFKTKNNDEIFIVNDIDIGEIKNSDKEYFVIGGESIYNMFLPYANKIYLTRIKKEYFGDRYFKFNENDFKITELIENNEYDFITYERK